MRKMKPIDWICFSCVIALSVMAVLFSACNTPTNAANDPTKDQTSVHETITIDPDHPVCPNCGSTNVIPIVYGYPSEELFQKADRGEVQLGGCVVMPDAPTWHCVDCGDDFGSLSDDNPEFFD